MRGKNTDGNFVGEILHVEKMQSRSRMSHQILHSRRENTREE
jgi:hypothetical protein